MVNIDRYNPHKKLCVPREVFRVKVVLRTRTLKTSFLARTPDKGRIYILCLSSSTDGREKIWENY